MILECVLLSAKTALSRRKINYSLSLSTSLPQPVGVCFATFTVSVQKIKETQCAAAVIQG